MDEDMLADEFSLDLGARSLSLRMISVPDLFVFGFFWSELDAGSSSSSSMSSMAAALSLSLMVDWEEEDEFERERDE